MLKIKKYLNWCKKRNSRFWWYENWRWIIKNFIKKESDVFFQLNETIPYGEWKEISRKEEKIIIKKEKRETVENKLKYIINTTRSDKNQEPKKGICEKEIMVFKDGIAEEDEDEVIKFVDLPDQDSKFQIDSKI